MDRKSKVDVLPPQLRCTIAFFHVISHKISVFACHQREALTDNQTN